MASEPVYYNDENLINKVKSNFNYNKDTNIVCTFDKNTYLELSVDGVKVTVPLLWTGEKSYKINSYNVLSNDTPQAYTKQIVKPYWRLKQQYVANESTDLATYMSKFSENNLPLINGFLPFDFVENNTESDNIGPEGYDINNGEVNDLCTLPIGVVSITDSCNVNLCDRLGHNVTTLNPITHPYLMYAPNVMNMSPNKSKLTCVCSINNMSNTVVIGGFNMNQLVFVDMLLNKIVARLESLSLRFVKKLKSTTTSQFTMICAQISDKEIELIDAEDPKRLFVVSLTNTTNCRKDKIVDFDVKDGKLVILTTNSVVVFGCTIFKFTNEVMLVSDNDLTKPDILEIHPTIPNVVMIANSRNSNVGFLNLNEYKNLVSFLTVEKLLKYKFDGLSTNSNFIGFTPVGDRVLAVKKTPNNNTDSGKIIKSIPCPDFILDLLILFQYNSDKIRLPTVTDESLDAQNNSSLNVAVDEYQYHIDALSGLNTYSNQSVCYDATTSLEIIDFLRNTSKKKNEVITSSSSYCESIINNTKDKNLEHTLDSNYKVFELDKVIDESNTEFKLILQALNNTMPQKFSRNIPSELVLPLLDSSAELSNEVTAFDDGPALFLRKLDIPIVKGSQGYANNQVLNSQTGLFITKTSSKFNQTSHCGLISEINVSEDSESSVSLNSILQFILYNPKIYLKVEKFLTNVPWTGKPLLTHELGYLIDGMENGRLYDSKIVIDFIKNLIADSKLETPLQIYQFIDKTISDECDTFLKKPVYEKNSHIVGYITNLASGKKKGSAAGNNVNGNVKYQKNITNHLDVLLSKEFQYAKTNHNEITTNSLTILSYMTQKEFKEVLNKNSQWLVPDFEVAISKISPQLFFKSSENDIIPKFCSTPVKYHLTSVLFEVDCMQRNEVTFVKFEDGWYLFNDHLVCKVADDVVFDTCQKYPKMMTYTTEKFNIKTDILKDLDYKVLKDEANMHFNCDIEIGSEIAMDSEYVIENYRRQEITSSGLVKVTKPEVKVLARLTVIKRTKEDSGIKIIIDDYIGHDKPIEDYLTKFSGIEKDDLTFGKSCKELHDRQHTFRKFWILVKLKCKVIGHGLKSDFEGIVINVPVEQVIDTAAIYWTGGRLLSLRFLYYKLFKITIQGNNHDSYEDAYAAMALYEKYIAMKQDPEFDEAQFLKKLFEDGRKCGFKIENI